MNNKTKTVHFDSMLQDPYTLIPEKVPGPGVKFLQWKNAFIISPSLPSKAFYPQWKPISRRVDPLTAPGPRGIGLTSQQQTLMNRLINRSNWTRVTNKPTVVASMKTRLHHQSSMKQKTHQRISMDETGRKPVEQRCPPKLFFILSFSGFCFPIC